MAKSCDVCHKEHIGLKCCRYCETPNLHWVKTTDGPRLHDSAGIMHRCTGAVASTPYPPASVPVSELPVAAGWEPEDDHTFLCDMEVGCGQPASWRKGRRGSGELWACDKHVPRIGADSAEPFTLDEPEPATPLPEYDGTFIGPQKAELVSSLQLGMHCLLTGPTATGKSLCAVEAFGHVAEGRPVFILDGAESLRESDLLGQNIPWEGHFKWEDGIVTRAMRAGGFLFLDEFNRFNQRTQNVMLSILERREVVLTENGSEVVKATEGFQVVAAMNLGKGYAVNGNDRALMSRFESKIQFTYLDSKQEVRLLVAKTGIPESFATKMVKVANETRSLRRENALPAEIDPRGLMAWAKKCKAAGSFNVKTMIAMADTTWMLDVAGTNPDGYIKEENAATLRSLIEAHS